MNKVVKYKEFNIDGFKKFANTLKRLDMFKGYNILAKSFEKVDMQIFKKENLEYVEKHLATIDKELNAFTKQHTNFIMTFLNLSLLFPPTVPERQAWQILAQVERKREALRDNYFRLINSMLKINNLKEQLKQTEDENQRIQLELEIRREMSNLSSAIYYYKSAFAELANLISMYEQMKKKGLIPKEWNEEDFEKSEVKAHLHEAFRQLMRSIIKFQGKSWDQAPLEYIERLGIHPLEAYKFAVNYYHKWIKKITEGEELSIEDWWEYLEDAERKFSNCIYKVLEKLGLENYYDERFIYKGLPEEASEDE